MRRFLALSCALIVGVLCAVLVSACDSGGGGISSANASELLSRLDEIDELTDDGECEAAAQTATATAEAIAPLSTSQLDPELKTALVNAFERLADLTTRPDGGCSEAATTTETTTEEDTTPEPTITEEPTVTTTPTQPTTPTDTGGGTGGTGAGGGVPSP